MTTNPSIVAACGQPLHDLVKEILAMQQGPLAVQVIASDTKGMLQQAHALWNYSKRLIIKVPVTEAGLACMHQLKQSGIPIMATAVFEPQQALLAFKVGARYLAPYIGRIRDQGHDPRTVLEQIRQIKHHYTFDCKILGAGLRTQDDVTLCATLGLCAVTLPEKVFNPLFQPSEGLNKALTDFNKDWQRALPTHLF